jgi:enterochelin esterase-like enzyme
MDKRQTNHFSTGASPGFSFNFSQDKKGVISIDRLNQVQSTFLSSRLNVDVYLPPGFTERENYPILFFNDGQEMENVKLTGALQQLYAQQKIAPILVVAIHAAERLQEYGTVAQADYKQRGSKARLYSQFILEELIPHLSNNYPCSTTPTENAFAGFSLGGLSAFDLAWHFPETFRKAGVFSGSFWWRSKEYSDEDPDGGRIMHELVRQSTHRPGMRFWFQTGTMDETCDRNKNGIIDAIDDTLDIIRELETLGYRQGQDIHYREVEGGIHHPSTWAEVLPEFLVWAFGNR